MVLSQKMKSTEELQIEVRDIWFLNAVLGRLLGLKGLQQGSHLVSEARRPGYPAV